MRLRLNLLRLFVLLLPTQLTIFFWPDFSLVNGARVDYLAPVIYFTDFVFGVLLISMWKEIAFKKKEIRVLVVFFVLALINIYLSLRWRVSLIYFLRIVQGYLFYKIIKLFESKVLGKDKLRKEVAVMIAGSIFFLVGLAVLQFINKGSIGGNFYYLGERRFNLGTPGIAGFNLNNKEYLRSS